MQVVVMTADLILCLEFLHGSFLQRRNLQCHAGRAMQRATTWLATAVAPHATKLQL